MVQLRPLFLCFFCVLALFSLKVSAETSDEGSLLPSLAEHLFPSSSQYSEDAGRSTERKLLASPVAWWWYFGISGKDVQNFLKIYGARLTSLQVSSVNPLRFSVAMVQRAPAEKPTFFVYDRTFPQLVSDLTSKRARITDIDVYTDARGQTRFSASLIADGATWWWYVGIQPGSYPRAGAAPTPNTIVAYLLANRAKLIDIDSYVENGIVKYAVVMVPAGTTRSFWYTKLNVNNVADRLRSNAARLVNVDLEASDASGNTVNVIMEVKSDRWFWWYGVTNAFTAARVNELGTRIGVVKRQGSDRFLTIHEDNL